MDEPIREPSEEIEQIFRDPEPFDISDNDFWRQELSREENDWSNNGNNSYRDNRVDVHISLMVDRARNVVSDSANLVPQPNLSVRPVSARPESVGLQPENPMRARPFR